MPCSVRSKKISTLHPNVQFNKKKKKNKLPNSINYILQCRLLFKWFSNFERFFQNNLTDSVLIFHVSLCPSWALHQMFSFIFTACSFSIYSSCIMRDPKQKCHISFVNSFKLRQRYKKYDRCNYCTCTYSINMCVYCFDPANQVTFLLWTHIKYTRVKNVLEVENSTKSFKSKSFTVLYTCQMLHSFDVFSCWVQYLQAYYW